MLYLKLWGLKAVAVIEGKMHESLVFSRVEKAFGSAVPVWSLEFCGTLGGMRWLLGDEQWESSEGAGLPTLLPSSVECL